MLGQVRLSHGGEAKLERWWLTVSHTHTLDIRKVTSKNGKLKVESIKLTKEE